jgi:hypothetical protein
MRAYYRHPSRKEPILQLLRSTLAGWPQRFPIQEGVYELSKAQRLDAQINTQGELVQAYLQSVLRTVSSDVADMLELDVRVRKRLGAVEIKTHTGAGYGLATRHHAAYVAVDSRATDGLQRLLMAHELVHLIHEWRGIPQKTRPIWAETPAIGVELWYADKIGASFDDVRLRHDELLYRKCKLERRAPWDIIALHLPDSAKSEAHGIGGALALLARKQHGESVYAKMLREPGKTYW